MALANVKATTWPDAMDQMMTNAIAAHGRAPDSLPNISRGDAMRIVQWARKQQKKVDLYPTTLRLLGYEKPGDKFKMEPAWVMALVPKPATFWNRAIMELRFIDGRTKPFVGKGRTQAIWSEEAAVAWIRLQAERGKKLVPRNPLRGMGTVIIVAVILYVLSTRN